VSNLVSKVSGYPTNESGLQFVKVSWCYML